jgi:hypothetical protein
MKLVQQNLLGSAHHIAPALLAPEGWSTIS